MMALRSVILLSSDLTNIEEDSEQGREDGEASEDISCAILI